MSAQVDTITKLSYLLPTGTFLTFQMLAPLATNSGHCGLTEQILTAVTLALLVSGCIATGFTDSYTAMDSKVYNGFPTSKGLRVLGYGATGLSEQAPGTSSEDKTQNINKLNETVTTSKGPCSSRSRRITSMRRCRRSLSSPLTMFTDPVSTCFYPHLSETVLKTLPVLLTTVLSFCCSFVTNVRHGYGNSVPGTIPAQVRDISNVTANADPIRTHDVTTNRMNNVV